MTTQIHERRSHLDDPVSLPIVMLTLRLARGRWAYRVPRTGEWTDTGPGVAGEGATDSFNPDGLARARRFGWVYEYHGRVALTGAGGSPARFCAPGCSPFSGTSPLAGCATGDEHGVSFERRGGATGDESYQNHARRREA